MRKILVVDDNRINRETLRSILQKDYEILEAENGKDALTMLMHNYKAISAVLLEISMPVMDGYELLCRMKENPVLALIPAIVITGSANENDRVKALSLGANDFLTKPYNPHLIKHCLRNNISMRENAAIINGFQRDSLTGLYKRDYFFERAAQDICLQPNGYYTMASFDIDNFKLINERYGTQVGDELLKELARTVKDIMLPVGGIVGRITADNFASLFPTEKADDSFIERMLEIKLPGAGTQSIPFSIGRCVITDKTLAPSAAYDRALIAKRSVKGRYDAHMAYFDEVMLDKLQKAQQVMQEMDAALAEKQFEVWYQPQYNHATGTTPITWSVTTGTLPAGLSLSTAGVISGTPTAAGTSTFTVKAENGAGSDTKDLSITVTNGGGGGGGSAPEAKATLPVSGSATTIKVEYVLDGGAAVLTAPEAAVMDTVTGKAATANAPVVVDLTGLETNVKKVSIPNSMLQQVAASGAAGLEIKFPGGENITFDAKATDTLAATGSGELRISVNYVAPEKLTANEKAVPGVMGAYELEAYVGDTRIHDFKGGAAELYMPNTTASYAFYEGGKQFMT